MNMIWIPYIFGIILAVVMTAAAIYIKKHEKDNSNH